MSFVPSPHNTRAHLLVMSLAVCAVLFLVPACDCDYGEVRRNAELTLNPSSVVFPLTTVGETSQQTIEFSNKDQVSLEITKIELSKESNAAFTLKSDIPLPLTLEGGEKKTLEVSFAPTSGGGASGELHIYTTASNADNEGRVVLKLRTLLNAPEPVFSCGKALDFGSVEIGKKKTLTCTLKNRGTSLWGITELQFSEGGQQEFFVDATFPIVIQPNAEGATIQVSYSPIAAGKDDVLLKFITKEDGKSNEDEAPVLSLKGKAASATIEVQPEALIFPFTSKGKQTTKSITALSRGEIPLEITGMLIEPGSSPNFSVKQGTTFPISIPVGGSASLPIEYKGGATNLEQGIVTIASNDPDNPKVQVRLFAVADGCDLVVSPRKLTFPTRKTVTVILTNQGNRACTLKRIALEPTSSKDYKMIPGSWPVISLAPNTSLEFFVEYRPSDNNNDKGEITIESDDPDEPTITLTLEAPVKVEACELSPNPFVLNFGRVPIGQAQQKKLSFVNEGLRPCEIKTLSVKHIAPLGLSAFQIVQPPTLPVTVQPNGTFSVELLYAPSKALWYEAQVILDSDDPKRPSMNIKMLGSAGPLCIRAVPDTLDLGKVKANCQSAKQTIAIYNICSLPLDIKKIALTQGTSSEFKITNSKTLPVQLKRGEAVQLEVAYHPTDLTQDSGSITISNSSDTLPLMELPIKGAGIATETQSDQFVQSDTPKVDLLFVIDDSYSMSKHQQNLSKNLQPLLTYAQNKKVDFQIAVTTTSVEDNPSPTQRPGGCFVGTTDKLLTPKTPNLLATFQKRVIVGTKGAAIERGMDAMYRALTAPLLYDPNCNLGFLRKDASLSVIFISDEPDQSINSLTFYNKFYFSLKGATLSKTIQASAITAPWPGGQCPGATSKGLYWTFAKNFGGATESICNTNWNSIVQKLAASTFGLQRQFFLTRPASAASITVTLDGKPLNKSSYTYDAKSNSISFTEANAPKAKQTLKVDYSASCQP